MRLSIRLVCACLALLTVPAVAQPAVPNPLVAIKEDRWADAQAAASGFADPVAEKLVRYYRLLAPGAATAPEIAAFMQDSPDWPSQALLERRRQDAIVAEPDQATVLAQCALGPPTQAAAMLRCAEALAIAGQTAEATALARQAWVSAVSDPATETAVQARWNGLASAADQWARFQRLAWGDATAALRQVARLDPSHKAAAEARLALKRNDPAAESLYGALPLTAKQGDPGLMLDRVRFLRRADRAAEALSLWQRHGEAAQAAAAGHLGEFWSERNLLARKLLQVGDNTGAYALVAAHGQPAGEALMDAEFLAGFIALRRLNDPAAAQRHFAVLAAGSKAAITQGRAHYWLGRAVAAAGGDPTAEYRLAAAWPTTFYGQLACVALGEDTAGIAGRIDALRDPAWTSETVFSFTGHEVIRAAAWLVAWGDPRRARPFLLRMDELAPVPAERALVAAFALRVGLPDMAVFVARRIGRDGGLLPQAGWPMPYAPPQDPVRPLDAAVALGIMRQESSFDVGAVSPSGARGLMQLMPPTATAVARRLGVPVALPSLTSDPAHNMRLGTQYLSEMLDQFSGSLPLAAAAYNAGPHRVTQWLLELGDPRAGNADTPARAGGDVPPRASADAPPRTSAIDMIDWIEMIPFNETRNYVQRVLENVVIYRARRNEATPTLLAQWTR